MLSYSTGTSGTGEDVDLMIPHQANTRILEAAAKIINFPMEKVFLNIEKYGIHDGRSHMTI